MIPILKKVLGPRKNVDMQSMFNYFVSASEVPFAMPAYIALIARAVAMLEGQAVKIDPNFTIMYEAYPFAKTGVLQKLYRNQLNVETMDELIQLLVFER